MSGETILIVEDNPLNLELISDILEAHGYRVQSAISGSDALKMVEEEKPDLILMDIQLPGLDGLTITEFLWQADGLAANPPRARGGGFAVNSGPLSDLKTLRAREEGVVSPKTLSVSIGRLHYTTG